MCKISQEFVQGKARHTYIHTSVGVHVYTVVYTSSNIFIIYIYIFTGYICVNIYIFI